MRQVCKSINSRSSGSDESEGGKVKQLKRDRVDLGPVSGVCLWIQG